MSNVLKVLKTVGKASIVVIIWINEEAAKYFRIGESKLRDLVTENPNANFVLMNGNRVQIKRKLFERYIDSASVV